MDPLGIIYGIAVAMIAIIGLYKAYKNDNKITREEFDEVVNNVEDLLNSKKE